MTMPDVAAALEDADRDLQFGVTAVVNGYEVWLPPHEHRQALNDLLGRDDGLAHLWARLSPGARRALGALLFADARTRRDAWRHLDDAAKPYLGRLLQRLGVPPAW